MWRDVATPYQTTSRQNFDDVTLCIHITAERENVFVMFNFVSLIKSKRRNVRKSAIEMMTNIIVQFANRIQKPPPGAGFCSRWVKYEGW